MTNKIIIYDGVCVFCNKSIQLILRGRPNESVKFIANNSILATTLISKLKIDIEDKSILFVDGDHVYYQSDAILKIIENFNSNWRYLYLFKYVPKVIRDIIYTIIANNRYKFLGKTVSCKIFTEEEKKYFLN